MAQITSYYCFITRAANISKIRKNKIQKEEHYIASIWERSYEVYVAIVHTGEND